MEALPREPSGVWPRMVQLVRAAFAAAVKQCAAEWIAYGTDAGGYAWTENQAQELGIMVEYGMTPLQAIRSATSTAARLLDQSDNLGAIAPGHFADLIGVREDPLRDITALQRVGLVMQ